MINEEVEIKVVCLNSVLKYIYVYIQIERIKCKNVILHYGCNTNELYVVKRDSCI